jgi:hypothetical protein
MKSETFDSRHGLHYYMCLSQSQHIVFDDELSIKVKLFDFHSRVEHEPIFDIPSECFLSLGYRRHFIRL